MTVSSCRWGIAKDLAPNCLLAVGVALGFYFEFWVLAYVTSGFIWLLLVTYIVVFLDRRHVPTRPESFTGCWASRLFDVAVVLALANASAYLTALAYVASCFILYACYQRYAPPAIRC